MGRRAVVFALLLCFLWGGLAPALKLSLRGMPALAIAGWRFLIALLCILFWCRANQIHWRIPGSMHTRLVGFATLFAVQIGLLNLGTQWTSSNHTVVLLNTNPVFVALLAHFLIPNDRLSRQKLVGLLLAFGGICLTFWETGRLAEGNPWMGDLIVLLSGVFLGVLQVYTKFLVHWLTPFQVVAWEMIYGVPLFFLANALFEKGQPSELTPTVVLSLLYQGVAVGAFCFAGWTHLLQRFAASTVTAFQFTTPLFGVALSTLILGDVTSRTFLVGVALVALGIYWVSRTPAKGNSR
jgi:drug/metabolite transporter (DMT)-like permease